MAVIPFLDGRIPAGTAQLLYSCLFFTIAFLVALKPDKLTDRLGKVLTPCLLTLIAILFIGCILKPASGYGGTSETYQNHPFVKGFLEGYLTMDTIAALNFGIIISLNIRALGVKSESSIIKETIRAGVIAGGILLLVYAALAHIGAVTGGAFGYSENGAQTLNQMVRFLFGKAGLIMLAAIFFIACLNTCIGLISCCSRYFCTILPRIGYRAWAFVFAAVSLIIANAGLNRILEISVPVLNAIYPAAIVLILLSFLFRDGKRWQPVYVCSIALTGATSIAMSLYQIGITPLGRVLNRLPLHSLNLEWISPAVAGIVIGMVVCVRRGRAERGVSAERDAG